jgi:hypothetical protein
LGVNVGDELNIEIVGRALVIRSADEAPHSGEFADIFESVLKKRRSAREQMAEGPA